MKEYTQEMRINHEPCPYCGFWHSSISHGDQFFGYIIEIQTLEKEISKLKEKYESADFWNNWVYPDGATAEQIQDELADYQMIINEVSKVYDHVTDGRISKPNTLASEVIMIADDRMQNKIDDAVNEMEEYHEQ